MVTGTDIKCICGHWGRDHLHWGRDHLTSSNPAMSRSFVVCAICGCTNLRAFRSDSANEPVIRTADNQPHIVKFRFGPHGVEILEGSLLQVDELRDALKIALDEWESWVISHHRPNELEPELARIRELRKLTRPPMEGSHAQVDPDPDVPDPDPLR